MSHRLWISSIALALCTGLAGTPFAQETDARFADLKARGLGLSVFTEHCASCHGRSGHGNGPRVKELSVPPGDLTRLAERNGWRFPAAAVARVIDGADRVHRSGDMPLWGDVFRAGAEDAKARIDALTLYLEFIQVRPRR